MSKAPKNKKARLKTAKSSQSRYEKKDEEIIKSNLMKFAEELFEFDEQGHVIKRYYDGKGIEIPQNDDEEIDPDSLKEKEEKKVKINKTAKKKVDSNKNISFDDLLKKPD